MVLLFQHLFLIKKIFAICDRALILTLLAAQANGQKVELMDDDIGFRCNKWGSGSYKDPQFDSVQAWFP
ncbi:hypothetical protein AFK69_08860 [Xenorhabdus sp. GDc328]|nr:hypothetical protein AAY47_04320 [Xenorhabdus griffiniae]KOP33538.1 hypothetical protein AFK69_08860 [Xenorhabdus sp. GDc328]